MKIKIRELENKDYKQIVNIKNSIYPEYNVDIEDIKYTYENFDRKKYMLKTYVVEKENKVIAYGEYFHLIRNFHPQRFGIDINVHPSYQRKGIGSKLYSILIDELNKIKAKTIVSFVRNDKKESISFLKKRKFKEKAKDYELSLKLENFNIDFNKYFKEIEEKIEISTLKEEMKNKDVYKKLYQLISEIMKDIPSPYEITDISFKEWKNYFIKNPNRITEAFFIAKHKGKYIGLSNLNKGDEKTLFQGLTGVLREYRNRRIAFILKLKTIIYAKEKGYKEIKTWNNSLNEPILKLNKKLGFKIINEWITFEKKLN